jgi:hypothetical protein
VAASEMSNFLPVYVRIRSRGVATEPSLQLCDHCSERSSNSSGMCADTQQIHPLEASLQAIALQLWDQARWKDRK